MPPQHRFLEPIHNVKEGRVRPGIGLGRTGVFIAGKCRESACLAAIAPSPALAGSGASREIGSADFI
jgi:hypothetical protein